MPQTSMYKGFEACYIKWLIDFAKKSAVMAFLRIGFTLITQSTNNLHVNVKAFFKQNLLIDQMSFDSSITFTNSSITSSASRTPECPLDHSMAGIAFCSAASGMTGSAPASAAFMHIMSTYILRLVEPAQSSPGYGSEMNCPLKTRPALSSPTRII